MNTLVIRHGLSEANNQASLAFGSPEAHLMAEGMFKARALRTSLMGMFGVDTQVTPVAVSELARTQETAVEAGFENRTINSLLNEVVTGLPKLELKEMIGQGVLPKAAIPVAEAILENPPTEQIWITHGLVIAGLCEVLGVAHEYNRFIPRFCEVRQLSIGQS